LQLRNIAVFPHSCGNCLTAFKTAAKLVSHLGKRGRCKPAAAEVPVDVGADGVPVEVGDYRVPVVVGDYRVPVEVGDTEVPVEVSDTFAIQLIERIRAAVPAGFGDHVGQPMDLSEGDHQENAAEVPAELQEMNLGEGDIVLDVPENLEEMLRPGGPLTFIMASGGADGRPNLQPMI
jgi:hypothetical protein